MVRVLSTDAHTQIFILNSFVPRPLSTCGWCVRVPHLHRGSRACAVDARGCSWHCLADWLLLHSRHTDTASSC